MASFCGWLTLRGDLAANPFDRIPRPQKAQSQPRPMPAEYVLQVLQSDQVSARDKAIIATIRFTGLRCGELIKLDMADVQCAEQLVVVHEGKGGKDRVVPLMPELAPFLQSWIEVRGNSPGPFFLGRLNQRINREAIERMLAAVLRRLQLPKFEPHSIRHTFGTEAIRAGVNPRYLQVMMGHSSLNTTQLYADVVGADLGFAARLMSAYAQTQGYSRAPGPECLSTTPGTAQQEAPAGEGVKSTTASGD